MILLMMPTADGECDTTNYNRRTHKCCDGVVQLKPYGSPACCDTQVYNRDNYMCCSGQVTPRPNSTNARCCGTNAFDKDTEICCRSSGVVFPTAGSEKPGCCGGQLIDFGQ